MSRMLRSVVVLVVAAMMAFGASGLATAQQGTGTVRVLNYFCSYLESTGQVEAIDESECAPGAGTFTFYLVGDGTADYEELAVDASGIGTISLAAGTYEVVAEQSQTHFTVSVVSGETTQLLVGNPSGGAPTPPPAAETGTVTLQRYVCSYLDSTMLVEAIEQEQCDPLAATFSFYVVGDGTADYFAAYTGDDGQGSAELPVGAYELVDEYSQTHFDVNVLAGENAVLLIAGPEAAAPAPQPTQAPGAPETPTKLPNTGAGTSGGTGSAAIAVAGAVALGGAGAAVVRRMREDAI